MWSIREEVLHFTRVGRLLTALKKIFDKIFDIYLFIKVSPGPWQAAIPFLFNPNLGGMGRG